MEDRFKFRCFNPQDKTMHYTDFVVTATGFISRLEAMNDNNRIFYIDNENLDSDKLLKLMQCTGLKDKNGKLIFEGDILRNMPSGMHLTDLEMEKREYRYWTAEHKIYSNSSGFMVFGIDRRWHKELTKNMIYNCDCEIIGNIYENPELLEAEV